MKGLWVKLSVDYLDDPKIAAAGVEGEALFVRGLAWAKKQGKEGWIPDVILPRLGFGLTDAFVTADRLCELRLWEPDGEGWRIVAWESWQTSDPVQSAGATLGNHRRWHTKGPVAGCPHCEQGDAPARLTADRVFPDEAETLCGELADLMVKNGAKRPTITDTWRKDMDAINRIDGHAWNMIGGVLRWCQADPFWQSNILSPAKFRKQFDRLNMKASGDMPHSAVQSADKKPDWVADPGCFVCGGDGFASNEDARGNTVFGPCACRRAPE